MRPIVTHVVRSVVYLSVGHTHGYSLQKRLNRWKCRLGLTWVGSRNYVFDGVEILHEKGQFSELFIPMKSIGSLCCRVCSERDQSIFNNGMAANCYVSD